MAYDRSADKQKALAPKRAIPRKITCYRGYFPSVAMNDHLRYESRSVEKKLFWLLDFLFVLGLVKSIHPQPFRIEYGSGHYYHPDVLVIFRSQWLKPWLLEGKGRYFENQKAREEKLKYRAAISFARKKGFIFHFITQAQLGWVNDDILPFLITHQGKHVPEAVEDAVLATLRRRGPMLPSEIPDSCMRENSINVTVEQVWRLAANGKVFCDLKSSQFETVIAAPVPINLRALSKKVLFQLPFILITGSL